MIERESHIKELYDMKHFHDNEIHKGFDYENRLVEKLFSNVMFKNDLMREFLNYLQKNMVWMWQSTLVIRNFFNFTVSKYYDKHNY